MFQDGEEYFRADLIEFIGSKQQQSGIIWGNKEPNCVILTSGGKHGKNSGYGDERNEDGTWNYIGQGSKGDQDIESYANALILSRDKNILLFTTKEPTSKEIKTSGSRHKKYKFEGIFDVLSWSYHQQIGGTRDGDLLIVFKLIAAENIFNGICTEEDNSEELKQNDLDKLYLQVKNDNINQGKGITLIEYRLRSKRVKSYALKRADGYCELCGKEAPFRTKQDLPYLEVHHIFKLADDGPDEPENVVALCPNCHRKAHFSRDHQEIQRVLSQLNLLTKAQIDKQSTSQ